MKLTEFNALSFDCYGTLIDWEEGIHAALAPLLRRVPSMTRDAALEAFAQEEAAQEAQTPDVLYSGILSLVYARLCKKWGVSCAAEDAHTFGASVPEWPAFVDSAGALQYLKKYYKLIILSNVDRASFRGSQARLQVDFDAIYTAQDIGAYKPAMKNFDYLLAHARQDFGLGKEKVLHVAQSLFHDHAPANQIGMASVWIDRRYEQAGWGATLTPAGSPHYNWRFTSMADFAKAHQEQLRST